MASQQLGRPSATKLLCYRKDGSPFCAAFFSCPLQPDPAMPLSKANLIILVDCTSAKQVKVGKFLMGRILGKGASGVVRKCKNTATG